MGGTQQKTSKWVRQSLPREERPRKSSKEAVEAMVDKKGFRERELLEEGSRAEKTDHWEDQADFSGGGHRVGPQGNRGFMP